MKNMKIDANGTEIRVVGGKRHKTYRSESSPVS